LFYAYGKIHGLENIAFCDTEDVKATKGNPVLLQQLINKVNGPGVHFGSHEELISATNKSLEEYKGVVDKMGLNPSDRKKLLALPFYMAKRKELPEPKKGQKEYHLFNELYGQSWYDDLGLKRDPDTKITEFDYENYFSPELLAKVDTASPEFKNFVRMLNLTTHTNYERLQANKKKFSSVMPLMAGLTDVEKEALIHKI
jgi:hypothetical protein